MGCFALTSGGRRLAQPGWPKGIVQLQNVPALGYKCNQRHAIARAANCIAALRRIAEKTLQIEQKQVHVRI